MKYAFNPVKNNCLRRVKLAIKNGQRSGNIFSEMAKLGVHCDRMADAHEFYQDLLRLSPKRRRAILKVARVALKKNDLVYSSFLTYMADKYEGGDLRKILFVKEQRMTNIKDGMVRNLKAILDENLLTVDELHAIVDQVKKERLAKNENQNITHIHRI
jgi:putative heme degradation protein